MLIDPFIVVAQIINFLILVALLKRFLYKPITQAMQARSQRIERQLAAAASKEQDAKAEKELYLQKQQELEAQRQKWLEEAKQEVAQVQERLERQAQSEVNLERSQWYGDFERDRARLTNQIRDRLTQQVVLSTRQALSNLANANLEEQIIETFINRLYDLDDARLKAIRAAPIRDPLHIITIRSSFEVTSDRRDRLIDAIKKQIATTTEIAVQFEIEEDLICGIELRDRGYKISWTLKQYLTELETETAKILSTNN